jgi:hypothetical protein
MQAPDPVSINKTAPGAWENTSPYLVEKSQEVPSEKISAGPSKEISSRPSQTKTKIPIIIPRKNRLAAVGGAVAVAAVAALASPVAASPLEVSAVHPQAVSSQVPASRLQLPPVGTRIEILTGEYKGKIGVVESIKNKIIWASPEGRFPKPARGYFWDEVKILADQNPPEPEDL